MCVTKNHFSEKSFGLFNRAPFNTIKKNFDKIIYNFFKTSMKYAFCISSRYALQKCTDVVTKRILIL